jgi:DNA mismatch repair protein PMS2
MIGSPLTRQQQGRILARLAQLDAPFNCPHGRPTMRHLAVLPVEQQQEEQQPETAAE